MNLSEKILAVEPSLTLELNAKAIELQKQGLDIVKLTAGEPDFPTPPEIVEATYKAMLDGKTKYTDAKGILELRKKVSEYLKKRTGLDYDPNTVIISNGGKQALFNVLLAILNDNDEVLCLDPSWVSYDAQIKMVGGVPVHVKLEEKDNFMPTTEIMEKYITPKTKAVIINSPNNPTGLVYDKNTLQEIADVAKKHDLYVISDEVYELLVYEGEHISIATFEGMFERTIIINAFSKTWSMTGWRVGYCVGPEKVMKQVSKIQSHLTSNIHTPSQYGCLVAFDVDVTPMWTEFKKRKEYVCSRLDAMGLKYLKPNGAFYVFIDVKNYGMTDMIFSEKLLSDAKIAVVPGAAFYMDGYIRISFASSLKHLEEAMNRLETFIKGLK